MKEIVVARFKEDLDEWSFSNPDIRVTIYNKGPFDARFRNLPNMGREAGTWLYHIINNYDELADLTFFAQGSASPHFPQLVRVAKQMSPPYPPFTVLSGIVYKLDWTTHEFDTPATRHEMAARGIAPGKIVQDNARMWGTVFNTPISLPLSSPCGGQFAATRETITRLPREFYEHLYQVHDERAMFAWEMEPMWSYIFTRDVSEFRPEILR